MRQNLIFLCLALAGVVLLAAFAPLEKTLGTNARLVYVHGAWVWAALAAFLIAAVTGTLGILKKSVILKEWSLAWGRTALGLWIIFLLMSLYVMQVNWNGIFMAEPRFRIPLNYAVVGLVLQIELFLLKDPSWAALFNTIYAVTLWVALDRTQSILHPDSPIFNSGDRSIQMFFVGLLVLLLLAAWQLASLWLAWQVRRRGKGTQ